MKRPLYASMAVRLVLVFLVVGAVLLWLTGHAMNRYSQAVTQRVNATVAAYVSEEFQLIAHGIANTDALQQLAHHAMIINPAVEVYLLDPDGRILSHVFPPEQVVRQRLDLAPVQAFLSGKVGYPLLGDDPRHPTQQKIFSAQAVSFEGALEGYVYVVLQSKQVDSLQQALLQDQVFRLSALAVVGSLSFGVVCALMLFLRFTRRIQRLSDQADRFFQEEPGTVHADSGAGDELDRLQRAMSAMQQRIDVQVGQIRQADAMRKELITNISHDLRTPLTNMLGYVETLLLKRQQLDEAAQVQYLQVIRQHGQRLGRLVADLFELARLDSQGITPQMEPFSMGELIHDVVQDVAMGAEARGVTMRVSGDVADSHVVADIRLMARVMENLLDNALRHTPAGGRIDVCITRQAQGVRVTVADTGEGIDAEHLPYIFDRFFHVRDADHQSLQSTGLGLAIVKRILDLHVSAIRVDSQRHKGTRFEFDLAS